MKGKCYANKPEILDELKAEIHAKIQPEIMYSNIFLIKWAIIAKSVVMNFWLSIQ